MWGSRAWGEEIWAGGTAAPPTPPDVSLPWLLGDVAQPRIRQRRGFWPFDYASGQTVAVEQIASTTKIVFSGARTPTKFPRKIVRVVPHA